MPEDHQIDVARRLVVSRAWGVLSTEELAAHYRAVSSDPDFDPTYAQLIDLRNVTRLALDTSTIRSAALDSYFNPGVRRAIVAPTDVVYGLARMFGAYAESVSQLVSVFRTMDDAERWLGVSLSSTPSDQA